MMRPLWLALGLTACGFTADVHVGAEGAGFPHPASYPGAIHGPQSLEPGAGCQGCHARQPEDPRQGAGPACGECHPSYPHQNAFLGVHGSAWSADRSACEACHGQQGMALPAGESAGRCVGCHSTYPHGEGWRSPSSHGASVLDHGGPEACASCHAATGDFDDGHSCGTCHKAYPHPSGYIAPSVHGAAWKADPDGCFRGCHAPSEEAGDIRPCVSCHASFPHAEGWNHGHVVPVQAAGDQQCLGCHQVGGPELPVSCGVACHGGDP